MNQIIKSIVLSLKLCFYWWAMLCISIIGPKKVLPFLIDNNYHPLIFILAFLSIIGAILGGMIIGLEDGWREENQP